jgi:hypothetical protein
VNTLRDALIEDFSRHEIIYELMPELLNDKEITSMVRYYKGEEKLVEREQVRE